MENKETNAAPVHAEPILAVKNIEETVEYWHNVLGFPNKWTWGDPPNYGGVNWHNTSVQFNLSPDLATASTGNAIFIKVKNLQELYRYHQHKSAVIIEPLENKPWGMAGYTVKEINGYYIIFAGALISEEKHSESEMPSAIRLVPRIPTIEEYQSLAFSVGWHLYNKSETVEKLLAAPVFGVIAEDNATSQTIGCVLLLTDHASFYYVKDLIVHPDWQGKRIGSALMKEITTWLDNNAANNALVALITGEHLSPFYQQFGFAPAFGMVQYIQNDKK